MDFRFVVEAETWPRKSDWSGVDAALLHIDDLILDCLFTFCPSLYVCYSVCMSVYLCLSVCSDVPLALFTMVEDNEKTHMGRQIDGHICMFVFNSPSLGISLSVCHFLSLTLSLSLFAAVYILYIACIIEQVSTCAVSFIFYSSSR